MNKMTKQKLLEDLALLTDIGTKAAASRVLDHLTDIITAEIKKGNSVHLGDDFGTFKAATQAAKSGVALGKAYSTPTKTVIKFVPSAALKRDIA